MRAKIPGNGSPFDFTEDRRRSAASKSSALSALLFALCYSDVFLIALCSSAQAEQAARVHRIGFIVPGSLANYSLRIEAFRHGLRELGYVENQNITIEGRWADGMVERLPELVTELTRLQVDVLVVGSASGALAAKKTQTATPVVFAAVTDPLGYGLIASLPRPGGNLTGTAMAIGEGFSGKWVELLKQTVPKAPTIAVLRNPNHPLAQVFQKETQAAASALGVKLHFFEARDSGQVAGVLSRMDNERAAPLIVIPDPLLSSERSRIVEHATRRRLPSMFASNEDVDAGGLMSYGPSFIESYRRTAVYVDKILKGAKPADLPVEQPTKFELVINLKTAKQIGLTIPANVLAKADKVIR